VAAVQTSGTVFSKPSFMGAATKGWGGWKADFREEFSSVSLTDRSCHCFLIYKHLSRRRDNEFREAVNLAGDRDRPTVLVTMLHDR
jgi:hypothetical protein